MNLRPITAAIGFVPRFCAGAFRLMAELERGEAMMRAVFGPDSNFAERERRARARAVELARSAPTSFADAYQSELLREINS